MRMNPPSILLSLLVAGLSLTGVAAGQSAQQTPPPAVSAMLAARSPAMAERYSYVFLDPLEGNRAAAKADDAQHQNFTLHGHWVIDVKNADGSVAEHRDFENAIAPTGPVSLFSLLAGYSVPSSDYAILLVSNGTAPCNSNSGCGIVRSTSSAPGNQLCGSGSLPECATGLTETFNLNYSQPSQSSMVLAGSFTAGRNGTIDSVATYGGVCPALGNTTLGTVSPATCKTAAYNASGLAGLSQTTIPTFTVTSGQIVQVSVTITFS